MSPESTFEITELKRDEQSVSLHVNGDLTVDTSPQLQKMLSVCFGQKLNRIHVVLDGVPRMDSSGIATLVDGLRWSRLSGSHFVISGLSEAVQDLFIIAKLDSEFEVLKEGSSQ